MKFTQASSHLREAQLNYQRSGQQVDKQNWQKARLHFNICQDAMKLMHSDQRALKFLRYGNKSRNFWPT